jgi:hypothetical protein
MLAPYGYVLGDPRGAFRPQARHTTWPTCTTQRKASQAINRPQGCVARGPHRVGFRFIALLDLNGVV